MQMKRPFSLESGLWFVCIICRTRRLDDPTPPHRFQGVAEALPATKRRVAAVGDFRTAVSQSGSRAGTPKPPPLLQKSTLADRPLQPPHLPHTVPPAATPTRLDLRSRAQHPRPASRGRSVKVRRGQHGSNCFNWVFDVEKAAFREKSSV